MRRALRYSEIEIMRRLAAGTRCENVIMSALEKYKVEDMDDGGMGSVKREGVEESRERPYEMISSTEAVDVDGTPVFLSLFVDDHCHLAELDVWKGDFSPVIGPIKLKGDV
ncbi:DUF6984 family protein [Rhodoligotrophos defluvii]|uniref:DUF6984 family protein n=1 Tax=Rhodoligotrophos defluvii TaxID=2561934 RepID=UPI0010C99441|nr:hypothetical protein [Rhodoligotrophos defluvii]